jgi:alpha-glucosidase
MKKNMTKPALFLLLFFSINELQAQPLSKPLGNLKSFRKITNGIAVQTDFGNLKATVYSANIVKINITRNEAFDDFSYAVVPAPDATARYEVKDEKNEIILSTDSLYVTITKKPVRVALYTKDGRPVNADDEAFGTSWIGEEITTYKKLYADEKFLGLGEKTGGLNRRGQGYTNWNTDYFGYDLRNDPLYSTIPFYIGIHDSLIYGVYLDNSSRSHFNFGASQDRFSFFTTENGDMNYYLIYHSTVAKVIESYTWLTGRMTLPPIWSLGFHQCRYSYYPEAELLTLARTFRDKKIPCDVIWFDIHYMDSYKVFTWDPQRFPDPKGMLGKMESMGFKNVVIIDPGIKVEKGYVPYEDGLKKDVFLKYPDGSVYTGQVWPGWCTFTDFTNPAGRVWWGNLFHDNVANGLDGFWCDMNEIATWGQKMPDNIVFDFEGHPQTHKMGRNIYGFQMARATFEGSKELLNGKRPFILTRAGFSGLQRYTAIWTGDNLAYDDHMLLGVRLVNSLGLSGIAFAGYDVGGFGSEATRDLYSRWISLGAFSPFYRSHKAVNEKDSDPWNYGEKVEEIARNYIQLRYNLLPYIYSAFYEATQTGMPVQRSLAINFALDETVYNNTFENEYLFGPSLLIVPCSSEVAATKVYLPQGEWYDLYNNSKFTGPSQMFYESPVEKLPIFIRGGALFPCNPQFNLLLKNLPTPWCCMFIMEALPIPSRTMKMKEITTAMKKEITTSGSCHSIPHRNR